MNRDSSPEAAPAHRLLSAAAVRERAHQLLEHGLAGRLEHFTVHPERLGACADEVVTTIKAAYPDLEVPFHARWRHFTVGGFDRWEALREIAAFESDAAMARAAFDLAIVSVLLDAGAGPAWRYEEGRTGETYTRSEGLAVASFHAFTGGLFSSDPDRPLQADAAGLRNLVTDRLGDALQVSDANELVGLRGRATLLRRLGEAMSEQPETFGDPGRPSGMLDALVSPLGPNVPPTAEVGAHDILTLLLESLSRIWPMANVIGLGATGPGDAVGGVAPNEPVLALGDCWRHSAVRGPGLTDGWMPFHKLSQWLAYSLIEPFERAGVKVRHLEALTALPEYRNGGLLIDSGVIVPRDKAMLERTWKVGDEFVVEWRALTIALLDELAGRVRKVLDRSEEELPLARVLEGGTWAAGRVLAQRLRGGTPPLRIESDGTVF